MSELILKTVYDLRLDDADESIRYFIPAYQRGYRWTPRQVSQLLDDIREFTQRENPQPEQFYCLQPLVIRKADNGAYEVVDGQQRLTTLLLILRHFNDRLSLKYQQKLYQLEYETRPSLNDFLANPSSNEAASNIDFFHIAQAVKSVSEWFAKRESEVEVIKDTLLNKTKVIWYQLSSRENAVAAFTRLNVGKIPLTNGELIRALFLKRRNSLSVEQTQLQIAYEWDVIEKNLQSDDFWCFLSNETEKRGGRIDLIFDLVSRQNGMMANGDEYAIFNHFNLKLTKKYIDIEQEWLSVKKTFMLLDEWFVDRRLYHLVGYLIWARTDLNELCAMAVGETKTGFTRKVRAKIFTDTFGTNGQEQTNKDWISEQLDAMVYVPGSRKLLSILLLFNLATLLENDKSNIRFQFESFKTEKWDIEHVRSVAPDRPGTPRGKIDWLERCKDYLESANEASALRDDIQEYINLPAKEATDVAFDAVYEAALRNFHEDAESEADNGIFNLVLLDSSTNRSYGNSVFAVKRNRVLELDRDGVFVPLCTRNVFLKCYNSKVDHLMFWTPEDSDGYRQAMIDTLHRFFDGG